MTYRPRVKKHWEIEEERERRAAEDAKYKAAHAEHIAAVLEGFDRQKLEREQRHELARKRAKKHRDIFAYVVLAILALATLYGWATTPRIDPPPSGSRVRMHGGGTL